MLKYFKTLDVYKSSNGNNHVDLKTGKATSYKWWVFTCLHPNKKNTILFNNFTYSRSTSKHQQDAFNLFRENGFNIETVNIGNHQMSYENFLSLAPKMIIDKIVLDHVLINRNGSKKNKNEKRILNIQNNIKNLEKLVELGCIVNLDEIETKINNALAEDLNRIPTTNGQVIDKSLLISAKNEMNNFDEIVFLTQSVNNLDEVKI